MEPACLTAASPEPSLITLIRCEFCPRPADWDVETEINGVQKSVWLCNKKCIQSKMILHRMEVI